MQVSGQQQLVSSVLPSVRCTCRAVQLARVPSCHAHLFKNTPCCSEDKSHPAGNHSIHEHSILFISIEIPSRLFDPSHGHSTLSAKHLVFLIPIVVSRLQLERRTGLTRPGFTKKTRDDLRSGQPRTGLQSGCGVMPQVHLPQ